MRYQLSLVLCLITYHATLISGCCRKNHVVCYYHLQHHHEQEHTLLPLYEERETDRGNIKTHKCFTLKKAINYSIFVGTGILITGGAYLSWYLYGQLEDVEHKVDHVVLKLENHAEHTLNTTELGLNIFEKCPMQTASLVRCLEEGGA